MITEKFVEPNNYNHWDAPPLSGYIYHNVLSELHLKQLKNELKNIIQDSSKITFLTNVTVIHDKDKQYKLGSNFFNNRFQNVLYDLSLHKEYWYQTTESIYDWAFKVIYKEVSPNFIKYINVISTEYPFNERKYIPYRLHINYAPSNEGLGAHLDSNYMLFKEEFLNVRQLSLTFYTEDHIENTGGELYTINGFMFKAKRNTAIAMNGHQVVHGVTHNMNSDPRLAFTIRWAHVDDLFLPGHPDKHVWNVNVDI